MILDPVVQHSRLAGFTSTPPTRPANLQCNRLLAPPGAADGSLRIWDRRKLSGNAAHKGSAAVKIFKQHSEAIMRIEWHPSDKVGGGLWLICSVGLREGWWRLPGDLDADSDTTRHPSPCSPSSTFWPAVVTTTWC